MLVELHLLQNFAPSNLNRDDTNSPKDCEFGGVRRARISSQAIKRAMRDEFKRTATNLMPEEHRATRTKRLAGELTKRFVAAGREQEQAEAVAQAAVQGLGLKFQNEGAAIADLKTQYLLFLGNSEVAELAAVCDEHWDALVKVAQPEAAATGRAAKKATKAALPSEVASALSRVLTGGRAADVSLFGRMLADLPDRNIDAASQVAHAISTNRVSMEFDFYTAVDDLKPEDNDGADMLGTVEFNSSCFYRYANVDLTQLTRNLGDDQELVAQTVEAYIRAAVRAIPTGKQNSMAAQNPPSFVMVVVRDHGLWSLANAFVTPVRPRDGEDLVVGSQKALDRYWSRLTGVYGADGIRSVGFVSLDTLGDDEATGRVFPTLGASQQSSLEALVQQALAAAELGESESGATA